ncbi:MAG: alpha/beta hydrolase family protein [Polyangiaceae bacterium]
MTSFAQAPTPYQAQDLRATTHRSAVSCLASVALFALLTLTGCGSDDEPAAGNSPVDYGSPGAFGVGHQTLEVSDGTRTLSVELWYPAAKSAQGPEAAETYVAEAERAAFVSLLNAAPASCPTKSLPAERDAAPQGNGWPLIVYSHCVSCINLSGASLAIRLASHGFAVAAPNHGGPLPFASEDTQEPLTVDQLAVREADLQLVMDQLSSGEVLPEALKGHIDTTRIGALGHSFGSVTVGKLTQDDSRIRAVFGLAAPMENPILSGVDMTKIKVPTALLIAQEDNSVQEIGNSLMRTNYDKLTVSGLEVEVYDAGHWSVSDLCGIDGFTPGCGMGTRHSSGRQGESFEYLPVPEGIAIAQSYTTAFFLAELTGDSKALDYVRAAHPEGGVGVRFK